MELRSRLRLFWAAFLAGLALLSQPVICKASSLDEANIAIRTRQYPQAHILLSDLVKSNDAEAQYLLSCLYSTGKGIPQDYTIAAHWLILAAEQNHTKAQFNLGNLYEEGKGVTKNLEKAIYWYQKSADSGHRNAKKRIASLRTFNSNIAKTDPFGTLFLAIRNDDLFTLKQLLKQQQDVNVIDQYGKTPLLIAVKKKNHALVELLLTHGAKPNYQDKQGKSCLLYTSPSPRDAHESRMPSSA